MKGKFAFRKKPHRMPYNQRKGLTRLTLHAAEFKTIVGRMCGPFFGPPRRINQMSTTVSGRLGAGPVISPKRTKALAPTATD